MSIDPTVIMTDPTPTPDRPSNVVAALARVMAELPGIGRDNRSEQGYSYRGIEAITAEAQDVLGRFGVVFAPRIIEEQVIPLTINGRPWEEWRIKVVYDVRGPGWRPAGLLGPDDPGCDDRIEVGPLLGLGRDNSDKGANKAETQAYKYALIQTLCIGDASHDADREQAHEADAPPPPVDPAKEARGFMALRIRELSPAGRDSVRAWCDASGVSRVTAQWSDEQLSAAEEFVDRIVQAAEADAKAAESSQEPNPAPIPPETADEPQPALEEAPAPEDAAATAELVRAHDECWAMKLGQVRERLAELGLSLEGKPDEVRNRLEAELVRLRLSGKDVPALPKHPMPAPDAFPDSP